MCCHLVSTQVLTKTFAAFIIAFRQFATLHAQLFACVQMNEESNLVLHVQIDIFLHSTSHPLFKFQTCIDYYNLNSIISLSITNSMRLFYDRIFAMVSISIAVNHLSISGPIYFCRYHFFVVHFLKAGQCMHCYFPLPYTSESKRVT